MRFFRGSLFFVLCASSVAGVESHAQSRLMGDKYSFSGGNFPNDFGEIQDPVSGIITDFGTPPGTVTFDGVEETVGLMKINERAVTWPGKEGGIPAVQEAGIDGVFDWDLVDWATPGEVVEFSFETTNGSYISNEVLAQSFATMRGLDWKNSETGSVPEFFETGFYMYYSTKGVPAENYETQLPDIGLLVGQHPFDNNIPEVFYIAYSRSQVEEVTEAYEGGVDLTFGTTQLDENEASWAALATVMNRPDLAGKATGFHVGFLVVPPKEGTVVNVPGDVNRDGTFNTVDFDEMGRALRENLTGAQYDVNGDGSVSPIDREMLINVIGKTYVGDSNFDKQFDSGDFVFVFQAGQYEDGVAGNSNWSTGDWNADTEFDSGDFIAAFQAGGFEAGPRPAVSAVPEPSSLSLLALTALGLLRRSKK